MIDPHADCKTNVDNELRQLLDADSNNMILMRQGLVFVLGNPVLL